MLSVKINSKPRFSTTVSRGQYSSYQVVQEATKTTSAFQNKARLRGLFLRDRAFPESKRVHSPATQQC